MLSQFILLPLYIYPAADAWSQLYTAIQSNPSLTFSLVIDPDNGPGSTQYPDSNWVAGINSLRKFPNTQLLGYVHTLQATRDLNDVYADIDRYAGWAGYKKADLHMDGIFFDESPSVCDSNTCPYMGNATDHVKTKLGATRSYTVFNAGVHGSVLIDALLYTLADTIIVFEDYASQFSAAKVKAIPSTVRKQSAFILHDFSGDANAQTNVVNTLVSSGVAGVYITSASDYDLWSSLWTKFVSSMSVAKWVSASTVTKASVAGDTSSVGLSRASSSKNKRSTRQRRQADSL